MRLIVFQSGKGDCLLLETNDGKHRMLVDGGVGPAYNEHVSGYMNELRAQNKKIDVVYISHTDDDHIGGVLEMLDHESAWRIHQYQIDNENTNHKEPKVARPAEILEVWHNSFSDTVGENSGEIENMLAATAAILGASTDSKELKAAAHHNEIATSYRQSLRVRARLNKSQLNIPVNKQFQSKLMLAYEDGSSIKIGNIDFTVIGPFAEDLEKQRTEWNTWLKKHKDQIIDLKRKAKDDANRMAENASLQIVPFNSSDLFAFEIGLAEGLGNRKAVTVPNLASLMFYVNDGTHTMLLTGDGHCDDIIHGLRNAALLDADGKLHVDVLKVPHHGSEHNTNQNFCDAITADSYLFCGNGEHENPDLRVLKLIYETRLANKQTPFKFIFNSNSRVASDEGAPHMEDVEVLMEQCVRSSNGRLKVQYISGSKMEILEAPAHAH